MNFPNLTILGLGPIMGAKMFPWKQVLMNLIAFLPRVEGPLVVELVEFLRNHENLICYIDWGEWDFIGSGEEDDLPQIAIKSVRNTIPRDLVSVLSRSLIPLKIVLVEGANPDIESLKAFAGLMAVSGVGIYVRNYGWISLPSFVPPFADADTRLAGAAAWRKNEDGQWLKRCTSCGVEKTPHDFPLRGRDARRDPYKSVCKTCDAARKARKHTKIVAPAQETGYADGEGS